MVPLSLSYRRWSGQLGIGCAAANQFGDNLIPIDFGTDFVPETMGLGWHSSCFVSTNGAMKCIGDNEYVLLSILDDEVVVIVMVLLVTANSDTETTALADNAIRHIRM